ncbi:MAG: choice-of-anchor Q domain-containing protein, partial [Bacteroidales bacterium]|nr:choice-of-anchor Q domain-containing protein [Bacteroidales bacterium]
MRHKSNIPAFLSSTFFPLPSTLYLLSTILYLLSSSLSAAVLTVKQDGTGDYTTIQQAIDAVAFNDTVLVWPGTYFENLYINGKPLTLASLYLTTGERQYVVQTIIDGSNIQKAVIDMNYLPTGTKGMICGLTIQNGNSRGNPEIYTFAGGGIVFYYADATVSDCVIQNNISCTAGGGIAVWYSNLDLISNTIKNNTAYEYGGGVWAGGGEYINFDTIRLNNIYCNHSIKGNDICKHFEVECNFIKLDTFTVAQDQGYCMLNYHTNNAVPVYDYELQMNHAMISQVAADVYVSPEGDNTNSGLTPEAPLKNIWYAMTRIEPDTNNQRTIHVMPGTYSPSINDEIFPINARSNSALIGVDKNTCVLDAEETWLHYSARRMAYNLEIKNLTLRNGSALINENYARCGSVQINDAVYNFLMENVVIKNCLGLDRSGALLHTYDKIRLRNVDFINNTGGRGVTSFYIEKQATNNAISMQNCIAAYNRPYLDTYGSGGGIGITNSHTQLRPLITSNAGLLVAHNYCRDWWGGAEFLSSITVGARESRLSNITVAHNENENHLPGAYATWNNMTSYVYNSVFYGNEHPSIVLGVEPPLQTPGVLYLDYSLIEQGEDDIWNRQNYNILHYGANNIEGNPLFTGTGEHPYQLQSTSPCIDAGTPMYQEGMEPPYIKNENGKHVLYFPNYDTLHLPATDLAGRARIQGGRIDMGAYEFGDVTPGIWQERPQY